MKRFFDVVCSLAAIVLLSPVMLIIAIAILIDDGSPVLFKQDRVGLNNELFKIKKFRTMKRGTRNTSTADLSESNDCITKTGKFLRKTSLDELPQLFNVLDGSMSFVGPRPLIPEEDHIRTLRLENDIYSVRPGVTGWAQINGRDSLSDEEKTKFDREYIEKHSITFDAKIFFKTILVVLTGKDVVEGGANHHEE